MGDTTATFDDVVTTAAVNLVVLRASVQSVIPAVAVDHILASTTRNHVISGTSDAELSNRELLEGFLVPTPPDRIWPQPQLVGPGATLDLIGAAATSY